MKYTPYIAILAMLLATACAKEEIKEDQQLALPENGIRFSGTMGADDPADSPSTRTVYEDQEDRIAVQWELGDEIGLFCEVGEGADNLELTAGNYGYRNKTVADSKTADFSEYLLPGEVVCWSDETTPHDFYAYYPYKKTVSGSEPDPRAVPLELPAVQSWLSTAPLDYFSDIDFMYAEALDKIQTEVGEDQPVGLDFHHLFPVLQMNVRTTHFARIDAIIFRCTETGEAVSLGKGSTVDLTTREITAANATNEIRIEGSMSSMISSFSTFQMLVSPGHAGKTFDIIFEINGKEYKRETPLEVPEGGLLGGKTYVVTIDGLEIADEDAEPMTDLSEEEPANTYYVTEADRLYRFRADIRGNGQGSITGESVDIDPQDILVLWYSRVQFGYGPWTYTEPSISFATLSLEPDGYVYFKTPETFIPGQMVIAVFDREVDYDTIEVNAERQITNANILWSWNIIFAEGYDPDNVENQIQKGGYIFMDRDLGAIIDPLEAVSGTNVNEVQLASSCGNVYQWGRKDPFPGVPDYTSANHTYMTSLWFAPGFTPVTALQVGPYEAHGRRTEGNIFANNADLLCINIAGKTLSPAEVFDIGTSAPYLWIQADGNLFTDESAKAVWGNPDHSLVIGDKTMYDPCPPGWKVMSRAAWNAFTENGTAVAKLGIKSGDTYLGGRGIWYMDSWFPCIGDQYSHNSNGNPQGGTTNTYSSHWLDGSFDASVVFFNGTGKKSGDDAPAGSGSAGRTDRGVAVRCMKVIPGPVIPGGEDIDPIEKEEWK